MNTRAKKKRLRINVQPLFSYKSPACAVFAGIPNQTVSRWSQLVQLRFVGLATLTPIEQIPQPAHIKWFQGIYGVREHRRVERSLLR